MTPRFFILLFVIAAFASCDFKSAATYLQESKLAGENGDYNHAITLLNKAIDKNPKFKEAYIQRGLYYENLHHEDSALYNYTTLLSFDSANTIALYHSGLCKFKQKKFDEAIANYNKALVIKGIPNPSDTSLVLVLADVNKNNVAAAEPALTVSAVQLFYDRGWAYYSSEQIERAYHDFRTCIAQKYNLDECFYMSGLCWQAATKKACDAFKKGATYGSMASNHSLPLCR
ncbi:tetratricopeptide repeat protein [Ferruginibacter sp. SUN106]|uniref:tetratricopeptide repeat protein n=1 Tax=Ferruginibacter sp. SUN106 TaxID=2978348 RepID=UPI003D360F5A